MKDFSINYKELQQELDKFGAKAIEKVPEASRKYVYETKEWKLAKVLVK